MHRAFERTKLTGPLERVEENGFRAKACLLLANRFAFLMS